MTLMRTRQVDGHTGLTQPGGRGHIRSAVHVLGQSVCGLLADRQGQFPATICAPAITGAYLHASGLLPGHVTPSVSVTSASASSRSDHGRPIRQDPSGIRFGGRGGVAKGVRGRRNVSVLPSRQIRMQPTAVAPAATDATARRAGASTGERSTQDLGVLSPRDATRRSTRRLPQALSSTSSPDLRAAQWRLAAGGSVGRVGKHVVDGEPARPPPPAAPSPGSRPRPARRHARRR